MLPSSLVDAIFAKLTIRYGQAFMAQWRDLDIAYVKADWSEVLAGFDRDDVAFALSILTPDKPPNAMQFRELCRRAPVKPVPALPQPPVDPVRVAAARAKLRELVNRMRVAP